MTAQDRKSHRLTATARDRLREMMLEHRFKHERDELDARAARHADDVYKDIYGRSAKKMADLPSGWLPEFSEISVQFGDSFTYVKFSEARRVQQRHRRAAAKIYAADHKLAVEHMAIQAARSDLYERERSASLKVSAALNRASTTKILVDIWPEASPFVDKLFAKSAPKNLPAIPVADLNKALDLPVEEAA